MVADDLQYQANPKPGVQDRIRRYLNEGLERVLRRPRLKQLRLGFCRFHTAAGTGFYGVPDMLERIDYVIEDATGRTLPMRSREWYRSLHDPDATGTPSVWIPEGIGPVIRQPRVSPGSDPPETKLYISSNDPNDTTQIVRVRAYYHVGNEFDVEGRLQGTTPVQLGGGFNLFGPITNSAVSINALSHHFVFVNDTLETTGLPIDAPLAYITPFGYSTRHVQVRLYPAPTADWQYYRVEGQRVVPRMTVDEDEPPFSADFHEMLACYARGRFYRKDGRLQQSQLEMAEFERYALDLTAAIEYPVSYKPVAGKFSPGSHGWSDLGTWYPADRSGIGD